MQLEDPESREPGRDGHDFATLVMPPWASKHVQACSKDWQHSTSSPCLIILFREALEDPTQSCTGQRNQDVALPVQLSKEKSGRGRTGRNTTKSACNFKYCVNGCEAVGGEVARWAAKVVSDLTGRPRQMLRSMGLDRPF